MKRIFFTFLFIAAFLTGYSQLSNNGGTITVESGATIVIEGNYTSSGTASIEIDGSVQLKGDFVNNGGDIASGSTGTLTLNGTTDQTIGGTNTTNFYCAVVVNKPSGGVLLGANEVLQNALTLTSGKLTLNAYDLTMAAVGITADASNYVVTNNAAGELKALVGATDVTFPIGTATSYNPVILNEAGTSDTYGVVYSSALPGGWTGGTTHAVNSSWAISEGTSGGANLSVTPQWNGTQEQTGFTRSDCAVGVSTDNGATVAYKTSGAALGGDPYSRIGSGFAGVGTFLVGDYFFEGIEVDLDLWLAGAYDPATHLMRTDINGIIDNNDPYGNGRFVGSFPSNVVDWIEIQLRNQADVSDIIYSQSFLLDNTGNVLDIDGSPGAKITGVSKTNFYIAVIHRNHFGVVSNGTINLAVGSPAYNFSTSQNQAWQDASITVNDAMREIEPGVFGLWQGDVNSDGVIDYFGGAATDQGSIVTQLGATTLGIPVAGYFLNDINMDGIVDYFGGSSTDQGVLVSVLGATTLGIPKLRHLPLP